MAAAVGIAHLGKGGEDLKLGLHGVAGDKALCAAFFQEAITLKKLLGAAFIVIGVILYAGSDASSKEGGQ